MSTHRIVRAVLAIALGAAVIGIPLSSAPISASPGDGAPAESALTVPGPAAFPGLQVTVSQTRNLINQTVIVSWTGGAPTLPPSGDFGVNYLQIMQCWGDDPSGPDRTQCQFGGLTGGSLRTGTWVRSRQVSYAPNPVDPKETLKQPAGTFDDVYVPFWAAGRPKPPPATSNLNDFFDSQVTNEIPVARTHGDGTGQEFFEVQTVRQAAGLGCGEPVTTGGVPKGRSCWLVIVPRGNTEVDGSTHNGNGISRLDSSPLSQTNWDNRIVVPLEFLPVGQACPIGAPERRLIGHELAADAVSSWQPALCAGGGILFSYSQLTDDITRSQVLDGSSPGLALMTNPIPPDIPEPVPSLVYAPVALSGLAIAFNIEHQPRPSAPPEILELNGQRFTSMRLTPRLVAKLLTQSYRGAVEGPPDYLQNNPIALTVDPEFLELNPEYRDFANFNRPPDALVQLDGSDVTSLLWSWVHADPDASAFLAGAPDKDGMVVNPANRGLTLPTSTFPRNDQSCIDRDIGDGILGKFCTSDSHPFAKDMHDAGRSASRGDTQAQTTVLGFDNKTPVPKKVDRQDPGRRALLAVVDAATATRYGLPTAQLRNAAGEFVAPAIPNLLAGHAAMKPSTVPGVLVSDPDATDPAAYPLTALSYAVTSPSTLDAAAAEDYATFLRYAADTGQQPGLAPGQLPLGMAPLPDELTAQTAAAATMLEAQATDSDPGTPSTTGSESGPTGSESTENDSTGNGSTGNGAGRVSGGAGATVTDPGGANSGVLGQIADTPPAAAAPGMPEQPVAEVRRTPSVPAPAVGALLLAIFICGALAAASSPVMHRLGATKRAIAEKEVTTPTGQ